MDRRGRLHSAGFTLVEMLVSTALVLLIMSLFAQIYGTAVGTITEQRGMANNDQKARILSSILRSDLQNMTYRQPAYPFGNVQGIVPMAAGDEPIIDPVNQRGYFYFSENDPSVDWDDVLQFTTMIRTGQRGHAPTRNQQRPYVGKAGNLSTGTNGSEPDLDDGMLDNQGQSRAAEICYFLRNGNFYRRVFLLRDPLPSSSPSDSQPTTGSSRVFSGTGTSTYTNFYRTFDYSATRAPWPANSTGTFPWFNGIVSLDNGQGLANLPLAMSALRFGHNPENGLPVEFDQNYNNFIGRFTMQETSSAAFTFPGQPLSSSNPYAAAMVGNMDSDGVIGNYAGNDHVGEDLLLANVEAFNVEVLDPATNGFVDIGSSSGYFRSAAYSSVTGFGNTNPSYTANPDGNHFVFDTWHPAMTTEAGLGSSPYRMLTVSPANFIAWTSLSGSASVGTTVPVPSLAYQQASTLYQNYSFCYRVIKEGLIGSKPPEFSPLPGVIVQEPSRDLNGNGTIDFGETGAVWQCVDNRIGLRAIQITIRYRDVSSNLSRQLTLIHSFVE